MLNDSFIEMDDLSDEEFEPPDDVGSEDDEESSDNDFVPQPGPSTGPNTQTVPRTAGSNTSVRPIQQNTQRSQWKKVPFTNKMLDSETEVLCGLSDDGPLSPGEYFASYFPKEFWELLADQTNLYSVQERGKSVKTNVKELRTLAGIHLVMGVYSIPQVRMYWAKNTGLLPIVTEKMTRDRFFELRNHLHTVDNMQHDQNSDDRLWKVRPLLTCVKNACNQIQRPKFCSIDEQMIPFVGRCGFRQYLPSKPNPYGIKKIVLASSDGVVLDFLIYSGKGTVSDDEKNQFGLGGAVVHRLIETIPTNENVVLFTDRYFTGLKIVEHLESKGILCTGTVMANRTGDVGKKLKDVKDSKMKRGEWVEYSRSDDKIVVMKWKDNKCVHLMSSACGSQPEDNCQRWSKEQKQKVTVTRPAIVRTYNAHMGGIDLNDRFISYYRTSIRTRKWPVRVFAHFLDLAVVNSWVMYMRDCKSSETHKKNRLSLLEFRLYLAEIMINCKADNITTPVGRPRLTERPSLSEPAAKKRRTAVSIPPKEVRYDGFEHWPEAIKGVNQSRCRVENCTGKSRIRCTKCNVFLCLSNNNCFVKFHTKLPTGKSTM